MVPPEVAVAGTTVLAAVEEVRCGHSDQAWEVQTSTTAELVSLLVLVLALVLAVYIFDLGVGKVLAQVLLASL